jgi:hypothetical protein
VPSPISGELVKQEHLSSQQGNGQKINSFIPMFTVIAAAEEGIPVAHHMVEAAVDKLVVDKLVVDKAAVGKLVVGKAAVGKAAVGKAAADIHSHRDLDMLVVVVHMD